MSQQQMQQGNSNMVQPMTIMTWHEQRLNKMEEMLQQLENNEVNPEVIVPMVESIESLDQRLKALQKQMEILSSHIHELENKQVEEKVVEKVEEQVKQAETVSKKASGKKKGKKDLKKSVEESLETVRLTVKEKTKN